MPRELNDRLLMKTYYVVVEDVSFNARAVNLLLRSLARSFLHVAFCTAILVEILSLHQSHRFRRIFERSTENLEI